MLLSVVILNYNVCNFLEQCLLSVKLALKNIDAEVIVIDNASTDKSALMVKERFPEVVYIQNTENVGFPKANNIAVKKAQGEYVCILNPDTVVAEDTFEQLLSFAKDKKDLGIIGCRLIDGKGNFLPESKRNIPTYSVAFLKMLGFSNKYYNNNLKENEIGLNDIFVGAFMFLKKQTYLDLNGFDEDFFMYGEDIDLSYRFIKKGFKNYYYGQSTIIHYKGESTIKDKVYLQRFYGAMNIFYKKHFKSNLLYDVCIKIAIKFFALITNLKTNSISEKIATYYLISQDNQLPIVIENILNKKITKLESLEAFTNINVTNTVQLIIDQEGISFKEIIDFMLKNRDKNIQYRIKPKDSEFLVGSDCSKSKGKIIFLK